MGTEESPRMRRGHVRPHWGVVSPGARGHGFEGESAPCPSRGWAAGTDQLAKLLLHCLRGTLRIGGAQERGSLRSQLRTHHPALEAQALRLQQGGRRRQALAACAGPPAPPSAPAGWRIRLQRQPLLPPRKARSAAGPDHQPSARRSPSSG